MGGTATTEIHVFHYVTHSLVWHITTPSEGGCRIRVSHMHTPAGDDVYVECQSHLTRDGAESVIARAIADYAEYPNVLGDLRVHRHRDDAVRVATTGFVAGR
jgi:hypothetical protein